MPRATFLAVALRSFCTAAPRRADHRGSSISDGGSAIRNPTLFNGGIYSRCRYTFSRNRNGNQPFLLSCPVVRGQLPQLIRRHLGFLAALFIVQTTALKFRPNLPAYWITPSSRDASPFAIILGIFLPLPRNRRDSDRSFTSRTCPRLAEIAIARFQRRHGVRRRPSLRNTQAGRGVSLHDDCIFDCIIGLRTGRKVLYGALERKVE